MKKIGRITLGGLQSKNARLVFILLTIAIAMFAGIAVYQNRTIVGLVDEARERQQEAISQTSEQTMNAVLADSFGQAAVNRADMSDRDFSEVVTFITTMKAMAEGLFENQDMLELGTVLPPDPAKDGTLSAHVLFEENVDYTKSEYLGIIAHMSSPLLAMCENMKVIDSCYVGLADGTHLSIDSNTKNRYDETGKQIPYPVRERPWYKGAVEAGGLYFTGIEKDAFGNEMGITCAIPIYHNGEIVGVAGADMFLDNLNTIMSTSSADEVSSTFVINEEGQVIISSINEGLLSVQPADKALDLRTSENKALADFASLALKEKTGIVEVTLDEKQYYLSGAPMPTIGWAVIMMLEKEITEQPKNMMLEQIDSINDEASATFRNGNRRTVRNIVLMFAAILIIGNLAAAYSAGKVVKPLENMTRDIVESSQTGKLFKMQDIYRTDDEIEVLAEAFDDLSKKTKRYIEDITRITQEKERISTELELARKIQADMLPYIYPAFPDRAEFDIYATMNPAREVGGDFYDYFLIDQDHLGMVIADVSGKGVPAALFMMMSKILINNFAMMGGSPAEVLEQTNATICQNNADDMFVTAWFGILEIPTGRIIAANAGHEYPMVRKVDGEFEILKDKHGFVLGGMEGMKYENYEIVLKKGGMLFLYTDGVPESTNVNDELFGVKRVIEALNQNGADGPVDLLGAVKNSVSIFAGEADQFDDLTMLALLYR
ncbi:MAG: SpoIIE family protein phosphatase [Blautia sp.]|nr:SpoIIE family protein phosphatase [Blautia sp.]